MKLNFDGLVKENLVAPGTILINDKEECVKAYSFNLGLFHSYCRSFGFYKQVTYGFSRKVQQYLLNETT